LPAEPLRQGHDCQSCRRPARTWYTFFPAARAAATPASASSQTRHRSGATPGCWRPAGKYREPVCPARGTSLHVTTVPNTRLRPVAAVRDDFWPVGADVGLVVGVRKRYPSGLSDERWKVVGPFLRAWKERHPSVSGHPGLYELREIATPGSRISSAGWRQISTRCSTLGGSTRSTGQRGAGGTASCAADALDRPTLKLKLIRTGPP
jgi:hypothetical protein